MAAYQAASSHKSERKINVSSNRTNQQSTSQSKIRGQTARQDCRRGLRVWSNQSRSWRDQMENLSTVRSLRYPVEGTTPARSLLQQCKAGPGNLRQSFRRCAMSLAETQKLARELMDEHGLREWEFRFINSRSKRGHCDWCNRVIAISKHYALLNGAEKMRQTILHEIAHALTPEDIHGPAWKRRAAEIGVENLEPYSCAVMSGLEKPAGKFIAECQGCGRTVYCNRRKRCSCLQCSSYGKFDEKFELRWRRNPDAASPRSRPSAKKRGSK